MNGVCVESYVIPTNTLNSREEKLRREYAPCIDEVPKQIDSRASPLLSLLRVANIHKHVMRGKCVCVERDCVRVCVLYTLDARDSRSRL